MYINKAILTLDDFIALLIEVRVDLTIYANPLILSILKKNLNGLLTELI